MRAVDADFVSCHRSVDCQYGKRLNSHFYEGFCQEWLRSFRYDNSLVSVPLLIGKRIECCGEGWRENV